MWGSTEKVLWRDQSANNWWLDSWLLWQELGVRPECCHSTTHPFKICSAPKQFLNNKAYTTFMKSFNVTRHNVSDSKTCYKGQGYGECRSYNLGNTWYEEIGGCTWYHHWYPLELLLAIVKHNKEEEFMRVFEDHLMHNEHLERIFFDHNKPYF